MTLVQRMAVHLLDALDSRDVGPRVVSSETEYFVTTGLREIMRTQGDVSIYTSRYTQKHR